MSEKTNKVYFAPIKFDGTYGTVGSVEYDGEPVTRGALTFDYSDDAIVGKVIIPCKDCKYWNTEYRKDEEKWSVCTREHDDPYEVMGMDADDFCSRGERKDET